MNDKVVVLYIRLSKMDDNVELTGESESVANQRTLLHQFLDKHPDLAIFPRYEAIDDGYTGTNENRPKLQEVLKMAENGQVQAICVKDNSRFFRNYVKAGEYLDIKFPLWGVRFLSVTDGYDSENFKGMTADMEQALKNIIYASYPKMLSQSTISAKVSLMKQGKYVGGFAPYGYKLDPSQRHTLFIDEEAASVVRYIFDMAIEGKVISEIATQLNKEKIETPSQYFHRKTPNTSKFNRTSIKMQWLYAGVYQILTKFVYTGSMVSHKRKSPSLGVRLTVQNEPIIVENKHEAIVTEAEFEQAQKVISKTAKRENLKNHEYPLKGYVRCGNCQRTMTRRNRCNPVTYYCNKIKGTMDSDCPKGLQFPEEKLEEIVFSTIQNHIKERGEVLFVPKESEINYKTKKQSTHFSSLEQDIKKLQKRKLQDYEKYTQGALSKEDFLKNKEKLNHDISCLEQLFLEKKKQAQEKVSSQTTKETEGNIIEKLTHDLVKQYVKAVYIHSIDKVLVEFLI